jgi:hypothetical protein
MGFNLSQNMNAKNKFELIFDTRIEKFDGKIREVSQKIMIDGVEINSEYVISLDELVKSLYFEGEHYIFTCGCGASGCVGIFAGVSVSFENDLIHWKVRNPLSTSNYKNFDEWDSDAKTIHYVFNKKLLVDNISDAMEQIENNVNEYTVFSPYSFLLKDFQRLNPREGYKEYL